MNFETVYVSGFAYPIEDFDSIVQSFHFRYV